MTIDACAAVVERGDPDRFAAIMAAPVTARPRLWMIHAFAIEVARAAWASKEPLICQMRLQWWTDLLADGVRRAHDVAGPLHDLLAEGAVSVQVLIDTVAARHWDIERAPFADTAKFDRYLNDTAAGLIWAGVRALGAGPDAEPVARDYGWAMGLANYLRAIPALEAQGRIPLVDGRPEALRDLAAEGLARLARARGLRRLLGPGGPALLPGWQTGALLVMVRDEPRLVGQSGLTLSEFSRRGRLLWQATTGLW